MDRYLSELYLNRWRWVQRGIAEFRKGIFHSDIVEQIKPGTVIGVYGATQVGKTTLILHLLGISKLKMADLSKALRGGREKGNSSTVTAISYQQAKNDEFVLEIPGKEEYKCKNLNEFEKKIIELRDQVQQNKVSVEKPVIIQIPKSYFDSNALEQRQHEIQIIDLPGDNDKDEATQKQIEQCLKVFLPQCRLCIIVQKTSKIASLPKMKRNYVKEWQLRPLSFRIVLTRAIEDYGTRKKIAENQINTKEDFCNEIINQVKGCYKKGPIKVGIYPLDYGDTWDDLNKNRPDLYKKVEPWMKQLFKELICDLDSTKSPEQEVRQLRDMTYYIRKKAKEEVIAIRRKKKEIIQCIHEYERIFKREEEKINIRLEEIKLIMYTLNDIQKYVNEQIENINKEQFSKNKIKYLTYQGSGKKSVSWLRNRSLLLLQDFEKEHNNLVINAESFFEKKIIRNQLFFSKNNFKFKKKRVDITFLDGYSWDRYISNGTFEKDCKKCRDELILVNNLGIKDLNDYLQQRKTDIDRLLKNKIKHEKELIEELRRRQDKIVEDEKTERRKLTQQKEKVRESIEKWSLDKERLDRLDYFLKRAFLNEIEVVKSKVYSVNTPIKEKWMYHQIWNMLQLDGKRVFADE